MQLRYLTFSVSRKMFEYLNYHIVHLTHELLYVCFHWTIQWK